MKILHAATALLLLALLPSAHAHCPLCTVAVGGAAVAAKYYGMDTTIIGLLIGAFGVSTGLWIGRKIIKKEYIKFQLTAITLLSFLLTAIPLMAIIPPENLYVPMLFLGEPGSMFNKIYWVDKMLLGSLLGGITSLAAFVLHIWIKNINGKVLFPYQGLVFTLAALVGLGGILFFVLG